MNNIEQKVVEINLQILEYSRYLKYAKDEDTRQSMVNDIVRLEVARDIWLQFLS